MHIIINYGKVFIDFILMSKTYNLNPKYNVKIDNDIYSYIIFSYLL